MITTYRSRHITNGDIKYVCEHAHDTSGYQYHAGAQELDAPTMLCEDCSGKLEAGAQEVRVQSEAELTHTFRFPKGK